VVPIRISLTGATNGAGTAYPSEHLSSSTVFSGDRVTRSLVLCVCFVDRCLSFCPFMAIVLSVLRFTYSDYPFGIFKLFFLTKYTMNASCALIDIYVVYWS
jgi:hypothetical protein